MAQGKNWSGNMITPRSAFAIPVPDTVPEFVQEAFFLNRGVEHGGLARGVFLSQFLEELGLFRREVPGNDHPDLHQEVALFAPLGVRDSLPPEANNLPGLGAGWNN